jgi:Ca2+-binding EF-hand superfamily protein
LKTSDTDNDGRVNLEQFKQVIKDQKIDITQVEAIQIFGIFSAEKNGLVSYQ